MLSTVKSQLKLNHLDSHMGLMGSALGQTEKKLSRSQTCSHEVAGSMKINMWLEVLENIRSKHNIYIMQYHRLLYKLYIEKSVAIYMHINAGSQYR